MAQDLNDRYQPEDRWKAVVDHGDGKLVVNAGPGTGKTDSLLRKIEALLQRGVSPGSIYYLTFANSIVDAFRADIAKPRDQRGLGIAADELGIHVSTLHSLAFKVIKAHERKLKLPEHLELVDLAPRTEGPLDRLVIEDSFSLLHGATGCNKTLFNRHMRQLQIAWQEEVPSPEDLKPLEAAVSLLEGRYALLPYDRLVPIANGAITQFGLPRWLHDASHFLIDEFQDFNPAEQRHIQLISEPSDSVVVVGDVDQSIYSGRSASPEGLTTLLRGDVTTVNFVLCRRCPKQVVTGANKILSLIDPASHAQRALVPHKATDGVLRLEIHKSCKAEVDELVKKLAAWEAAGEGEVIALFPDRKVLNAYRGELERRGVSCEARTSSESVERLRALLRLAILRSQPLLERFLITYFRRLEVRFAQDILPRLSGLQLKDALVAASQDARWSKPVRSSYDEYLSALSELTSGNAGVVAAACTRLGHPVGEDAVAQALDASTTGNERTRVEQALATEDKPPKPTFRLRLLTMHSSKGLSKGLIVMPGLEDKWIPGASLDKALLEKHRLFFVALTRAEREVHISFPKTRAPKDPLNYTPNGTSSGPSRYMTRLRLS